MKQRPQWQIFKGEDGQWYARLRARNGRILAQTEGYRRRSNVYAAIESIIRINFHSDRLIVCTHRKEKK